MKVFSKVCSMILSMVLISSMLTFNIHAEVSNMTLDKQASVLNELGILQGNGTSYNLPSKLKRSEAATFIVRLLGQESAVKSDKDKYTYTTYKDVSPDEWYAPYVGFCDKNGIIGGYADGTFKPNDYLSEKAFLKMLLNALGYAYNIDYTWDNVYYTAYHAGLVNDKSYETKVKDDISYTRGDVVEAVFSTLKTEHHKTHIRMIQGFIQTLLLSKEKAISYGLIQDDVDTVITSIVSKSDNVLEVTFNEAIKPINIENLKVYETGKTTTAIPTKSITSSSAPNSYLVVLQDKQVVDMDYTLMLTQVIDQYGNQQLNLSQAFTGFRPSEVISDFFMISKVEPVSNNLINIYFTQPINENVLVPNYFTIKKANQVFLAGSTANITVSKMGTVKNGITLSLKSASFTAEDVYEITVAGKATSLYGVQLRDGIGDSVKFKASIAQNDPLILGKITTINSNTIKLDFNKSINPVIGEQIYSYYMSSTNGTPIQISKADVDDANGKSVYLTTTYSMVQNQKYNLMINNVNDASRQFSIVEKQYDFVSAYSSVSNVKIAGAGSIDANTILVYVDRPLDETSARLVGNYYIYNVTDSISIGTPAAVFYDKTVDSYSLKLYLPQGKTLTSNRKYEVKLMPTLKDASGNTQTAMEKSEFIHTNSTSIETNIIEAKVIGANTIKLTFNKEIALDLTNILNTNYSISYIEDNTTIKKTPIGVTYIDPMTIILKFDSIDTGKTYTLSFAQLTNYGGVITTNTGGKYSVVVVIGK